MQVQPPLGNVFEVQFAPKAAELKAKQNATAIKHVDVKRQNVAKTEYIFTLFSFPMTIIVVKK